MQIIYKGSWDQTHHSLSFFIFSSYFIIHNFSGGLPTLQWSPDSKQWPRWGIHSLLGPEQIPDHHNLLVCFKKKSLFCLPACMEGYLCPSGCRMNLLWCAYRHIGKSIFPYFTSCFKDIPLPSSSKSCTSRDHIDLWSSYMDPTEFIHREMEACNRMEESNEQVEKMSLKRNLEDLTVISETMNSFFSG